MNIGFSIAPGTLEAFPGRSCYYYCCCDATAPPSPSVSPKQQARPLQNVITVPHVKVKCPLYPIMLQASARGPLATLIFHHE